MSSSTSNRYKTIGIPCFLNNFLCFDFAVKSYEGASGSDSNFNLLDQELADLLGSDISPTNEPKLVSSSASSTTTSLQPPPPGAGYPTLQPATVATSLVANPAAVSVSQPSRLLITTSAAQPQPQQPMLQAPPIVTASSHTSLQYQQQQLRSLKPVPPSAATTTAAVVVQQRVPQVCSLTQFYFWCRISIKDQSLRKGVFYRHTIKDCLCYFFTVPWDLSSHLAVSLFL